MTAYRNLLLLAGAALLASSTVARAEDYKIGVINTDRILRESMPAKDAAKKIEQEFQTREAAVARQDRELRDLSTKLDREGSTMSQADRTALQRDVEARSRDLERTRRQLTEDLKARQFDEMGKIKERLDAVLTKLAKDQGYDLILQDGLFVRRSVDVTDAVIKALDTSK